MERLEHHASFDGWQEVYQHESGTHDEIWCLYSTPGA